jgi:RNA polymerase sigma-70 factor (ECF subfamily)
MPEGADAPAEPAHPLAHLLPAEEPALRRFVRSLRVPDGEVDDLVQEAFARAWRSRDSWAPERPAGAWLRKIAARAWIDLRARRARQPGALAEDLTDPRADPAPLRDDLEAALRRLPAQEREILLRFHQRGDALREIADELGMPLNTVKSHLHRARQRLAEGRR